MDDLHKQARAFLELADKATPGPWRWLEGQLIQTAHVTRDVWVLPRTAEDVNLITAARNDAPDIIRALLLRVESLQEVR